MRRRHKFKLYIKEHGYYGLYVVAVLQTDEEEPESPIKIGISDDPVTRLGQLQNAHFLKLVLYQHWWVAGKPVAVLAEAQFKERYKEFNIRGEWFDLDPDVALKLMARLISQIGPRFFTEESLVREMEKEAKRIEGWYRRPAKQAGKKEILADISPDGVLGQ